MLAPTGLQFPFHLFRMYRPWLLDRSIDGSRATFVLAPPRQPLSRLRAFSAVAYSVALASIFPQKAVGVHKRASLLSQVDSKTYSTKKAAPNTISDKAAPVTAKCPTRELHDWIQSRKKQSRPLVAKPARLLYEVVFGVCYLSFKLFAWLITSWFSFLISIQAYPASAPRTSTCSIAIFSSKTFTHSQFTAMLSVASLLNPAPSGPSRHRLPPSPAASSPTNSFADETTFFDRPIMPKQKIAKDAAVFTKGKPKGTVNFQPYERLDEPSLREARKFQVFPLGKIQDYCRHIPYNSGKKTSSRRLAGRALKYVFKLPGDDTEYVVMWDYNVGLVRMTPFFKCCKYSKTTPAKMLNMNPGLKEITHSITGGSIMAQGALIPIFGPDFPSICIPPDVPEHGRMIIDPTIIIHSTREADRFRRLYSNMVTSGDCGGISPSRNHRRPISLGGYNDARPQYPRLRVRSRPFISSENPYGIDTDGEVSPATDRGLNDRFLYSPIQTLTPLRPPTSSWTPVNNPHPHSHPHPHPHPHHHHHYDTAPPLPPPPPPSLPHSHWLSAVPRLASPQPYHHTTSPMHASSPAIYHHHHHHSHVPHMTPFAAPSIKRQHPPQRESPRKRSAEHLEHGHSEAVRVESSGRRDETSLHSPAAFVFPPKEQKKSSTAEGGVLGPEKKAALLLMNLSVRDAVTKSQGRPGGIASASTSPTDSEFPRKRQRASSM
ncbi:hypothetical protein PG984_009399 [Apiospora sp. TS-2023a]